MPQQQRDEQISGPLPLGMELAIGPAGATWRSALPSTASAWEGSGPSCNRVTAGLGACALAGSSPPTTAKKAARRKRTRAQRPGRADLPKWPLFNLVCTIATRLIRSALLGLFTLIPIKSVFFIDRSVSRLASPHFQTWPSRQSTPCSWRTQFLRPPSLWPLLPIGLRSSTRQTSLRKR